MCNYATAGDQRYVNCGSFCEAFRAVAVCGRDKCIGYPGRPNKFIFAIWWTGCIVSAHSACFFNWLRGVTDDGLSSPVTSSTWWSFLA